MCAHFWETFSIRIGIAHGRRLQKILDTIKTRIHYLLLPARWNYWYLRPLFLLCLPISNLPNCSKGTLFIVLGRHWRLVLSRPHYHQICHILPNPRYHVFKEINTQNYFLSWRKGIVLNFILFFSIFDPLNSCCFTAHTSAQRRSFLLTFIFTLSLNTHRFPRMY